MKNNISPEEKLLRLIRGRKQEAKAANESSLAAKYSLYTLFQKYSSSKNLRNIIWVLFVLSFIYLITSFAYPWFWSKKINMPIDTQKESVSQKIEEKKETKTYESYLKTIANRQIFSSSVSTDASLKPMPGVILDSDIFKNINLVGIIAGDNPQAIIEDKKAEKTYYLTKGQSIGEFQIEDIQEGKIILNNKGQRYELHL